MKTLSRKIAISIITGVGWLIFVLAWIGFYWGNFSIIQNLVVLAISLLVIGGINGVVWTSWGVQFSDEDESEDN
jgi:hypothetical protein